MTGEEQRRLGLLVLLSSSGCLGLPRYTDDGDGGDDAGDDGTTTQTVDEGPQGPDVTGPGPTSSNDDAASFVFQVDVGPITSPTTSPTTVADVSGDPSDTDGPVVPDACFAYGDKIAECYDDRTGMAATGYCIEMFEIHTEYYGPECGVAFEDLIACISSLSCEQFGDGNPWCEAEYAKMEEICTG